MKLSAVAVGGAGAVFAWRQAHRPLFVQAGLLQSLKPVFYSGFWYVASP